MSTPHEVLLASGMPAIENPLYIIPILVGATAAGMHIKKLTPQLHHTINAGERGVPLKRGNPRLLQNYTMEDVLRAEQEDPFSTERHYQIVNPGWYRVKLFHTIQTVDIAHQPGTISIGIESADNPSKKLAVHANIAWHVSPDGDNPVRAITRVQHLKTDKKDAEAKDIERRAAAKIHPLEERVLGICSAGLGRVLSGRTAEDLYKLSYVGNDEKEEKMYEERRRAVKEAAIRQCARDLIYYGVKLTGVDLQPISRTAEEVHGSGLITLGKYIAGSNVDGSPVMEPEDNVTYLPDNPAGLPIPRAASS